MKLQSPRAAVFALTIAAATFTSWSPALAASEDWEWDAREAFKTAQAEDKDLLLDFTGSDWCGWCIRLNEEVFSQDTFKTSSIPDEFVLTAVDFPQDKPQADDLKAHNQMLSDRYGIQGFPTIVLADSQGRPYASTGYQQGGAEAYVAHLKELQQLKVKRDEGFAKAQAASGAAKAAALDEALSPLDPDMVIGNYRAEIEQIVELGSDELKAKWTRVMEAAEQAAAAQAFREEAQEMLMKLDDAEPAEMAQALSDFIEEKQLEGAAAQEAWVAVGQFYFMAGDKAQAEATLRKALALAPESEQGQMITQILTTHFAKPAATQPAQTQPS